jgi:hypothetical protein
MARISNAAAGAAASMALFGGIAGAALAAVPTGTAATAAAYGAAGPVQVCNPTAVEYGTPVGCATSDVTAIEY